MKNQKLKILTITDLHLGLFNKTEKLVSNLINYFTVNVKVISKVDIIVLDGDTFDKLLASNSMEYKLSVKFIAYLVKYCKTYNIKLRILEGTPSHDNKQMEAITEMISRDYGAGFIDYKYISTISIEHMKEFNKHILYVPDKMAESGEEIQDKISDVLLDNGLSKVDLIFAHGNFNYQLPIKLKSGLSESFFMDICRYYIVIGHIHIRSIFKQIIAPGSFDRMEVNNEGPKGGVILTIGKDLDNSSFEFLDNLEAMRYDTLNHEKLNSKDVYKKVKTYIEINNLSKFDHLRLKVDSTEIFKEVKNRLVEDGYLLRIEQFKGSKDKKTKTVIGDMFEYSKTLSESFEITSDNVVELLSKRDNINSLNSIELNRVKELILGVEL